MNIRLTLEYNGAAYSGWQYQTNAPTVQLFLEKAAEKMCGHPVSITAAGRTDAGVHALGQVCHFYTDCTVPPEKMALVLNTHLPPDIRVVHSEAVGESFHARFGAKGKRYRYLIWRRPTMAALLYDRAWHIPGVLDESAMAQAACYLIGTHDFAAFMAAGSPVKSTVRTVTGIDVSRRGDLLSINVAGNGFLYNMVRIIVGTLVEVGRGRTAPEDMETIILSRDRTRAGATAPPQGLCLMEVFYDEPPALKDPDDLSMFLP